MGSPAGTPCAHVDVCGRQATQTGHPYCILHDPATQAKSLNEFTIALTEHLDQGRCNLRHFRLPDSLNSLDLRGRTFEWTLECVDLLPPKPILLEGATLKKGAVVIGDGISEVYLTSAASGGPVQIQGKRLLHGNTFRCDSGQFAEEVSICIEESEIHVQARSTSFQARLFVSARRLQSLDLARSTLRQGLSVHARSVGSIQLGGAAFGGLIDLSRIDLDQALSFRPCSFDPSVEIDLSGSLLKESLEIIGSTLPQAVRLNGTTIRGGTRIEPSLRSRPIRLLAPSEAPRLDGLVVLKNVDVAECRLVGNVIQDFKLSGLKWAMIPTFFDRFARVALHDETTCRRGEGPPVADIREVYENLKEMYRQLGDHVRSGDFHYGEMEMKLIERSPFQKSRSSEWWYGLASGYGTRPGRAFSVLAVLLVAFAMIYYVLGRWFVNASFWQALAFSVSVATLQRPEVPRNVGETFRSIVLAEALLGPVQIALFILSLRMRVRR